eukprot:3457577-Pleurochrysis_carterae.AAC.1
MQSGFGWSDRWRQGAEGERLERGRGRLGKGHARVRTRVSRRPLADRLATKRRLATTEQRSRADVMNSMHGGAWAKGKESTARVRKRQSGGTAAAKDS